MNDLPLKDQREVMERPFFSLQKRKRLKPIEYRSPDGEAWVKVEAMPAYGMATIWDADILIWAASVLNRMKEQGVNDLPRTLTTTKIGRAPSELQSLMRISYDVFCLQKQTQQHHQYAYSHITPPQTSTPSPSQSTNTT